jgi:hypothetical protein
MTKETALAPSWLPNVEPPLGSQQAPEEGESKFSGDVGDGVPNLRFGRQQKNGLECDTEDDDDQQRSHGWIQTHIRQGLSQIIPNAEKVVTLTLPRLSRHRTDNWKE